MNGAIVLLCILLLIPFTGVLMAITPYLMRRNEVFAVTVPPAAQTDHFVKQLKRRYLYSMFGVTAFLTGLALISAFACDQTVFLIVLVVGALVPCIVGYALMLRYRSKMQMYKRAQGWFAETHKSAAVVGENSADAPHAISLSWNVLYLPIIALTLIVGIITYPQLPDMVPMHSDLAGNVNRWVPKSFGIVAFPVVIQLFMSACFVFSHWTIIRSKKWMEPGAPATSAVAYGLFARAQSVFLLISGVLMTAVVGFTFQLSSLGVISLGQAATALMVALVPVVVGALVLSVVYGQAGSRVFKRMQASDVLLVDDDEYWKLGIFYFNPNDASLFLPERFGIGWTLNWARPAVWGIVVGSIVVTIAFVVAVSYVV